MMRSISYSRYLSTATAKQAANAKKPSGVSRLLTRFARPEVLPETRAAANTDITRTTTPL
jgi:hypothetical protein